MPAEEDNFPQNRAVRRESFASSMYFSNSYNARRARIYTHNSSNYQEIEFRKWAYLLKDVAWNMRAHQSYNRQTTITVAASRPLTRESDGDVSEIFDGEQHLGNVCSPRRRSTNVKVSGNKHDPWWLMISGSKNRIIYVCRGETYDRREIHSTYSEFDIDPINQRRTWAILSVQSPYIFMGIFMGGFGRYAMEDPLGTLLNLKFPAGGT